MFSFKLYDISTFNSIISSKSGYCSPVSSKVEDKLLLISKSSSRSLRLIKISPLLAQHPLCIPGTSGVVGNIIGIDIFRNSQESQLQKSYPRTPLILAFTSISRLFSMMQSKLKNICRQGSTKKETLSNMIKIQTCVDQISEEVLQSL